MERHPRPADPTAPASPAVASLQAVDDAALLARSVLSCPGELELLVDGVPMALGPDDTLGLGDPHGSPTFTCHVDSPLADAAEQGVPVLVTVRSGLGPAGGDARDTVLDLAGRLVLLGSDHCACCAETRLVAGLEVSSVVVTRHGEHGEVQQRVPLAPYRSSVHQLNAGYLQRSVEHANDCHQDELRRAVATSAGTRLRDVLGVRLTGLSTRGVEVSWVDPTGAHRRLVDFPHPARTPAELGDLLRRCLHAGLC